MLQEHATWHVMCSLVFITWVVVGTKHDKNQGKGQIERKKLQ
jgi:hypothetical protein